MTITTNKGIKHLDNNEIETMYLEFVTDYITITDFAKKKQISWFSAKSIIKNGQLINHNKQLNK